MESFESEGRTVKEAVETALAKCGLRRDQVEITVTDEGSAGFMGLGAKPAKVRLSEKRWGPDSPAPTPSAPAPRAPQRAPARNSAPRPPERRPEPKQAERRPEPKRQERRPEPRPEPRRQERAPEPVRVARERSSEAPKPVSAAEAAEACEKARVLVVELLKLMAIAAPTATVTWDADLERVKVSVESQDASLLVGRDGRALESLQFLATLMLARGNGTPIAIQVDALSYWEKRETAVLDEARRAVETVKATGKPVRMEPMDSSMRRLVHRSLASHADVTTSSEGEGAWRKLVIRPRAA